MRKSKNLSTLKKLALRLAGMDERIIEVFIHSDTPKDPFRNEEIYLVCHLGEPRITNDMETYNDEGFAWGLEMSEALQPVLEEMDIDKEVVVTPFNFELHEQNEYGDYYQTLFIRDGFDPILKIADEHKEERERKMIDNLPADEEDPDS